MDARRFGDAWDAFAQAATVRPGEASLHLGAGLAAFMLGRNDEARASFERALAIDPRYVVAAQWLGRLHYRAGRLTDAIATYEAALTHAPGTPSLEASLADWRSEAELQDGFHSWHGTHFTVLFERPADEAFARRVADTLEEAYWRIGEALTTYPTEPVTVVLYSRAQYRDITRLPSWTAAAYDGRIRVPVPEALEQPEELDRVLGHELVHAVVAMVGGRVVPVWLNEGLATVLAGGADAEQVLARGTARPSLDRLHGSFVGLAADEAQMAYAVSAHAARRLIELRGASTVVTLLRDLAQGAPFDTAFQQWIAMPYHEFQDMIARE